MKLQLKKCRTCGARGIGPGAVKLLPMNGVLYCAKDWKEALQWEEDRGKVVRGLENAHNLVQDMQCKADAPPPAQRTPKTDWLPWIYECAGMAAWALKEGDRRTFVHYFARAVWGWDLANIKGLS